MVVHDDGFKLGLDTSQTISTVMLYNNQKVHRAKIAVNHFLHAREGLSSPNLLPACAQVPRRLRATVTSSSVGSLRVAHKTPDSRPQTSQPDGEYVRITITGTRRKNKHTKQIR